MAADTAKLSQDEINALLSQAGQSTEEQTEPSEPESMEADPNAGVSEHNDRKDAKEAGGQAAKEETDATASPEAAPQQEDGPPAPGPAPTADSAEKEAPSGPVAGKGAPPAVGNENERPPSQDDAAPAPVPEPENGASGKSDPILPGEGAGKESEFVGLADTDLSDLYSEKEEKGAFSQERSEAEDNTESESLRLTEAKIQAGACGGKRRSKPPSGGKRPGNYRLPVMAAVVVLLLAAVAAYRGEIFQKAPPEAAGRPPGAVAARRLEPVVSGAPEKPAAPGVSEKPAAPGVPAKPAAPGVPVAAASPVAKKLKEAERLEQALEARRRAMALLIDDYRRSIDAAAGALARSGKIDGTRPVQAWKDPEVKWELETVQRRMGYIAQLEDYRRHLLLACDVLHYAAVRAQIDLQIVDWVENLTPDDLAKRLGKVIDERLRQLKLQGPETADAAVPALDDIVKEICGRGDYREPGAAANRVDAGRRERPDAFSGISAKPAPESEELDMSRLKELSAKDARRLAGWKGKRLRLDGLTTLSAEAAGALCRWPGEVLTLNGVQHLPAEAKALLSKWRGRRLEMMSLQDPKPWRAAARVVVLPRGKG